MDRVDVSILRVISGDLEISQNFYGDLAESVGIEEEELLVRLENMSRAGYIKRIAPVIKHRNTDYRHNGLAAFRVSESQKANLIRLLTKEKHISHVYERRTHPNWKFNIYGMTHGKSREEVETVIQNLLKCISVEDYKILYSTREFKKTSPNMSYLMP